MAESWDSRSHYKIPETYWELVNSLSTNLQMRIEERRLSFDGRLTPFMLSKNLTSALGLGHPVRAKIIGSAGKEPGIIAVVRPINIFDRSVHSFCLRPDTQDDGLELFDDDCGFEVWEYPGKWPQKLGKFTGHEPLKNEAAYKSSDFTKNEVVSAIALHQLTRRD